MQITNKDLYIQQLEKAIQEQGEIIRQQQEEIRLLKEEIEMLKEKIKLLNGKVFTHKYHKNYKPEEEKKEPSQRGRKPGFEGITRPLPDKVDEEKTLGLKCCPGCNGELSPLKETKERTGEDIVIVKQCIKRRYILRGYYCKKCRKKVFPKPENMLPKCRIGLNTMLYVCTLKYKYRMSLGLILHDLEENFGLKLSQATLVNAIRKIARLLGPKFDELKSALKAGKSVNADETSWQIDGDDVWLWKFKSDDTVVTIIDKRRSHEVPENVLGEEFYGVLNSDFFSAYNCLGYKKQKCWVHLLRHSKELTQDYSAKKESHRLHRSLEKILADAIAFKKSDPPLDKAEIVKRNFEKRLMRIANRYNKVDFCRKLVKLLKKHDTEIFTFIVEDTDWNNNAAERAIRPDVVRRKISGGNRSDQGARDYEVLASVMDTCDLRGEEFRDVVMETLKATANG